MLQQVRLAGYRGVTSLEIELRTGLGHGMVSGPLSALHKDHVIAKLKETRAHYGVYVLPEYVHGRATVEHRQNRLTPES